MSDIKIKGFFRVAISEEDKIVGDSGFVENMITNNGIEYFIGRTVAGSSGSLQIGYVSLGSGSAPASNGTALPDEVLAASKRVAPTYSFTQRAASDGTATLQWVATFSSANSFITDTYNISNIGLLNSVTSGSLFAGNTFDSSSCATNQNVNVTYQVRLSFS